MSSFYKVVAFSKNGSKTKFPTADGGRYTGVTPMIAAEKAGKVAARNFGAGVYKISLYETTRDSRNNTNEYTVKVTKKARRGEALVVPNVTNFKKQKGKNAAKLKNGDLHIVPSIYKVEVQ